MFLANLGLYKRLSHERSDSFAKYLKNIINTPAHLLDFGCGNMYTARLLLNYLPQLEVTGVDVIRDQNLTDEVLEHPRLHFIQTEVGGLPFPDDHFDYVLALATMHHTPNPEYYLSELKRVIKPSGRILLIEEMYSNALDKIYISSQDWLLNKMKEGVPVPLNFRSNKQYRQTFRDLQLSIDSEGYVRPIPTFMHHYIYALKKS